MKSYVKVMLLTLCSFVLMQPLLSLQSLGVKDKHGGNESKLTKNDTLVMLAQKEVGINKRKNPGRVLWYLKSVNINYQASYCAAFVRKMMDEAKIRFPVRSALARKYVTENSINANDVFAGYVKVKKGSLVIWYNHKSNWQGHVGMTREVWAGKSGKTIEGNTSDNDTRQGGNVEAKTRKIEPFNMFRIEYFTEV